MSNIINVVIKDAETPEDDIIVPDTGWYTSSTESSSTGSSFVAPFIGIGVISFALLLILMFAKRKWKRISHFGILSILAILGIGVSIYGIIANSRVSATDNLISITSSDTTITVIREEGAETETTYGVATATIKLNETTPLGYTIFAYTPDGNILTADTGEGTIEPVATNNSALTNNTWGIALTNQADIKAEDAIWNIVDDESNPLLVASFDESTAAGTTVTLRYGVLVDNTLPVGVYSANIEYKAYQRAYNITFDPGEGEITTPTKPVIIGEPIGELPTPVRTNYNFTGWYTEETGGTKIDESTVPTQNSTYFAHWERITYSITFNPGEGTIISGDTERTVQAGEPLGTLPEVARDNYTFTGWYTQETGGERVTTATIPTEGTSYYAHWSRDTYTITFNAGEGTIDQQDAERSINAGDAIGTLPEATRTNYTLDGWYTAETGGTKITAETTPTGSTTYYAHWTRIEYTITYNLMGGNIAGDTTNPTATVQAGETLGSLPQDPSKTNYTFAGWYTAETGGDPVTTETRPDGATTYFAHWNRIEYTITFDLNGGNINGDTTNPTATVQAGDTLGNLPAEPSKENHTFAGWWTNETGGTQVTTETRPDSTTTYFAHWDKVEYTITYDLNGGNISGDTTNPTATVYAGDALGTLPTEPTRTNYTFAGWYTQLDGGTEINTSTVPAGTTTYFAHWNRIEYTITYNLMGGNIAGDTTNPTAAVYAGDTLGNLPTDPTKDDFVFAGWWTAETGGTEVTTATTPAGTTTYFAHWNMASVTVTFNANGGTLVGGGSTTTRDINSGNPLGVLPEVTRTEYTLAGWYTDANGGVRVTPDSIPSDGDTYYAHWEENDFPKVWSHDGACTFNASVSSNKTSSSPLGLTGDQCDYAGQDYIDTGIQLYSNTNHGNDYEIGFTIESYDPDENVKQATFMNTKLEGNSYPGAVVRRYDLNNNIDISSRNTSSANIREFVDVNTPMTVRLVRKDSISSPGYKAIYYAIDDDELTEINDLSNFDPEFNLNVWFGATPTNASATSAQRYLNGVMSNMYIRLGEYNEGSADTYTINFNAQGGTTLEPTRTIIAGYKLDTLPAPTRAGYVFDGWYTQESGGTKISENTIPSGGATYYARWISKYTIIYNANGRTFADDSTINQVEYTGSTATGTYKEPVGTNTYMFMGWGTASTDTSATYTSEEQVKSYYSANPGQTVTLYAVWANALTVSFDGNGSTEGTIDTIYVPANTTQTLPANAFVKDGYVFTNWSTNDDGTGITYSDKGSITVGVVAPGDTLTLYANWEVPTTFDDAYAAAGKSKDTTSDKYKIHEMTPAICEAVTTDQVGELVDVRDGTVYNVGKLADNRCWLLDNLALDAVASKANLTPENTNASPSAINNFITDGGTAPQAGWATTAVSYETSSSVYNQPRINVASKAVVPSGTLSTNGGWKVGVYYNYCAASIGTYCYDGGRGVDTDATSAIDVKNDICPAGWRMPTGGPISSTGANVGGGEYQALYDAYPAISGGDNQYTRFRKAFRLPLSGYFFDGSPGSQDSYASVWSSTFYDGYYMYYLSASTSYIYPKSLSTRFYGFSVRCVADNVTKNLITFNANGGIVDGGNTTAYKVVEGQTLGALPEATRDGYTFDGWYTQMDGGTEVTTQTIPTGAITYYAHWTDVTTFDEAYAAAGKSRDATSGKYTLQDMDDTICSAVSTSTKSDYSDTQETQLVDLRDGKVYWVAKLLDGKCWMTQNLDLDLDSNTALVHASSDIGWGSDTSTMSWTPERSTIPVSNISSNGTISGWDNDLNNPYSLDTGDWYWIGNWKNGGAGTWYDDACTSSPWCNYLSSNENGKLSTAPYAGNGIHGHVGNYYNWSAAIASNDSIDYIDSEITGNPQNSICPAGWRLPIVSNALQTEHPNDEFSRLIVLYGNTTSNDKAPTASPLWFVRGGYVYSDNLTYSGYYGFYWSSTYYGRASAYGPSLYSGRVNYAANSTRSIGQSVRCVARDISPTNLITFNANGGVVEGGSTTTRRITDGQALGALPEVTRDGYAFDGWYTAMDGGTEVTTQTIPAGAITYYAHWNEIITTFDDAYAAAGKPKDATSDKYKIHEMTPAICEAVTTDQVGELVDARDGTVYNVGKLADGRCWFLDNLALDAVASKANLTPENTNASQAAINNFITDSGTAPQDGWATTAVSYDDSSSISSVYNQPRIEIEKKDLTRSSFSNPSDPLTDADDWKFGVFYNYCAASIGTYCYAEDKGVDTDPMSTIDVKNDICPAGWRMPTGATMTSTGAMTGGEYWELYDAYPASGDDAHYIIFRKAFHFPLQGRIYDGSESNYGRGSAWSSTYYSAVHMYDLYATTSSVYPANYGTRFGRLPVRCIADNALKNLVTFNANGGIVDGGNTTAYKVTEGQALGALPEATRDGYTLDGWYTQMDGGTEITEQTVPTGTITYYAHWSLPPTTFDDAYAAAGLSKDTTSDKYKINEMTSSICGAVTTGQTSELVDVRDGTVYHVGKLADDRCWLLDNLALDAVAAKNNLSPSNTNASQAAIDNFIADSGTAPQDGWATTAVSYETSSSAYDQPRIDTTRKTVVPSDSLSANGDWKVGVYYNYCAASIGTYCFASEQGLDTDSASAIDVKNDICPAGWRMPTGGAISSTGTTTGGGEYQNLTKAITDNTGLITDEPAYMNFRNALQIPFSGLSQDGSTYDIGLKGFFWSSSYYDTSFMHYLYAADSFISPQGKFTRLTGLSVRCIAK